MGRTKPPYGIIIHCAATPHGMDIGFSEIDRWHKDRGWRGCGYHKIIRTSGMVEDGRSIAPFEQGAHCIGRNDYIGICWVGGMTDDDKIYNRQYKVLRQLCLDYMAAFGFTVDDIHGHNEFANKACPQIDMKAFKTSLSSDQS